MWIHHATPEQDARSRWPEIVGIALSFTVLMSLVVALRFWVRRRTLYTEDWVILFTAVLSIIYNALTIVETRYGLGLPIAERPKPDYLPYTKFNYVSRPFYVWGIAGFKVALCISYLRLTQGTTDKTYRRFIIVIGIFAALAETAFVFTNLFACTPVAKNLNQHIPGHCISLPGNYFSVSAISILCDVIVFLLPIPLIVKLRLDRSVKIGLVIIFCLGLLTTLCSILRLTASWQVLYGDGNSSLFVMYSTLELNIGIITSCLPVLRPLLKHLPRGLRGVLSYSRRRRPSAAAAGAAGAEEYRMDSHASGAAAKPRPHRPVFSHRSDRTMDRLYSAGGESDEDDLVARPARTYPGHPDGLKRMSVTKTVQIEVESAYKECESIGEAKAEYGKWEEGPV